MGSPRICDTFASIRQSLAERSMDGASRSKLKTFMAKAEEETRTVRMDAASSRQELKKRKAQLHRALVLLRSKRQEALRCQ